MQLEAIHRKVIQDQLGQPEELVVFEDRGISGAKFEERPGLLELLETIQKPAYRESKVLVYKFNRISRDLKLLIQILDSFDDNAIELISATEPILNSTNPQEKRAMINVFGVVAQFERDNIIENKLLGLAEKRRKGKPLTAKVPFGYRYTKDRLIGVDTELSIVRYIYDLYLAGELGYQKIVKKLNGEDYKIRGRPFRVSDIYNILTNKTYFGILKGGSSGGEFLADHQTIVTKAEFDRVQKIRESRQVKKISTRKNWLRMKIVCPLCNRHMTPRLHRRGKRLFNYYSCANLGCREKLIRAEQIEKQCKRAVVQFLTIDTALDKLELDLIRWGEEQNLKEKNTHAKLKEKRKKLFQAFEANRIDQETFLTDYGDLKKEAYVGKQVTRVLPSKKVLKELLEQKEQVGKKTLPDQFYFDLVQRVELDEDWQVSGVYLKNLPINIIEKETVYL